MIDWAMLGPLCVDQRPADPLDELSCEVVAGEIGRGNLLIEHHFGGDVIYRFGGNEHARHPGSFHCRSAGQARAGAANMVTLAGTRGNRELVAIMFASSGRVHIGRQSRILLSLSRHPLQEHRNRSGDHMGPLSLRWATTMDRRSAASSRKGARAHHRSGLLELVHCERLGRDYPRARFACEWRSGRDGYSGARGIMLQPYPGRGSGGIPSFDASG